MGYFAAQGLVQQMHSGVRTCWVCCKKAALCGLDVLMQRLLFLVNSQSIDTWCFAIDVADAVRKFSHLFSDPKHAACEDVLVMCADQL